MVLRDIITYKRLLALISNVRTRKKWMFLIVQMTFSGENSYVGHTSNQKE